MSENIGLRLTECPRDAMQGFSSFIPTKKKVDYLNSLLKVGFDVLDFGSFISHKAVPQMADTQVIIPLLDLDDTYTKLLAIVANVRGAEEAALYSQISLLGLPFSISETFQKRNTNKTITETFLQMEIIQNICIKNNKELIVYISMGFGNHYGDDYSPEIAIRRVNEIAKLGIKKVVFIDTVGVATPPNISYVFDNLIPEFPKIQIGAHFHSTRDTWEEKILAAYSSGCISFDCTIHGIGGSLMATDQLVGNIATEDILLWSKRNNIPTRIDKSAFVTASSIADKIFRDHE